MAKSTREQQLTTLYKMLEIQLQISTLAEQRTALQRKMDDTSRVRISEYALHHEENATKQRDDELSRITYRDLWGFWKTTLIIFGLYIPLALLLSLLSFLLGESYVLIAFVLALVIGLVLRRRVYAAPQIKEDVINNRYVSIIEDARKKDAEEKARYEYDVSAARKANRDEYQPQIDSIDVELDRMWSELEAISILSEDDLEHLERIVALMESGRAESVKEALRIVDDEVRREEEIRRKEEREAEERRRREEEEKAKRPGFVEVLVRETYGTPRVPTNAVYIDGVEYGCAPCKIPVSNGYHTAYAKIQLYYGGTYHIHQSPLVNFNVSPDTTTTVDFHFDRPSAIHCDITER